MYKELVSAQAVPPELDAGLVEIFERLVRGDSDLTQSDFDQLQQFSESLPPEVRKTGLANAKSRLHKVLLLIHGDKDVPDYDSYRRHVTQSSQQLARVEKRFANSSVLASQLECRPFMLPSLRGDKDARFIDFLKRHNYLSKQDIQNLGKKLSGFYNCKVKPAQYPAILELSLGNPDLLSMTSGQAKFVSHPTYKILNKALEHLGFPNLLTTEGRQFFHSEENSALIMKNLSKFKGSRKRHFERPEFGEISQALHTLQGVLEHPIAKNGGSDDEYNHLITAIFCLSAIMGSAVVPTLLSGLYSYSLARDVIDMSIEETIAPETLGSILDENGGLCALLDLQITCVEPLELGEVSTVKIAIDAIEAYILDYIKRYPELCRTISERFSGKNNALDEIRNQSFIESLGKFLVGVFHSHLTEVIESDYGAGYSEKNHKQFREFQSVVALTKEHIDLHKLSVQIDNSDGIHDDIVRQIQECIEYNELVGRDVEAFETKKKSLSTAVQHADYLLVSQIGEQLANRQHIPLLEETISLQTTALTRIIRHLVKSPNGSDFYYQWVNPKEEDSTKSKKVSGECDSRKLAKVSRDLTASQEANERLRTQLAQATGELEEVRQQQARDMEACDIVKQFMFGEKVSIGEVLKLVASQFPHVKFADNIEKQAEECLYAQPHKLTKFMFLLCGEYFDAISSGLADSEARQILGNPYRANESPSVLNNSRFRAQRLHPVDGSKHLFTRHLTISSSRDPKGSCSVYFDVIDGQLVIGYIGAHLDNTLT